ncbi:hypothetical protein K440DRAFT_299637 [Wilcoxina mikolae CBS 423.85]|nr:hypothetical protein K440DRAFT_299637 [Wilcoxina mikolae CBS 423.85]
MNNTLGVLSSAPTAASQSLLGKNAILALHTTCELLMLLYGVWGFSCTSIFLYVNIAMRRDNGGGGGGGVVGHIFPSLALHTFFFNRCCVVPMLWKSGAMNDRHVRVRHMETSCNGPTGRLISTR